MAFNQISAIAGMFFALASAVQPDSCTLPVQQALTEQQTVDTDAALSRSATVEQTVESPSTDLAKWVACPELLDLPPRGIACLQCTQPEAASQADALVQILLESCIRRVAINYLVDGSFSYDQGLLERHINALTADGRELSLLFYLSNGPSQRRYKSKPLKGFGTDMSPSDFRERIQRDAALQKEYSNLVSGLLPMLQLASSRKAKILIVPMLEDNLDIESFRQMVKLVKNSIPPGIDYRVGRNPCPKCSDGADGEIDEGIFKETHNMRSADNFENGVVTNDGDASVFEKDAHKGDKFISLEQLKFGRDEAGKRNSVFILWSAARQGLQQVENGSYPRRSATEREYSLPSETERQEILQFLRQKADE